MIPFNKPYFTGKETDYIREAVRSGKISGNGVFTQRCQKFFEQKYGFQKVLLTTSCTDALEMCAILAKIKVGDEVIVPSFTFVSTALAFERQGAKIVFADSKSNHPNIDEDKIEDLITSKTKAIVLVHYAGVACNMDKIMSIASKYDLLVIEDAAQAIDSFYIGKDGVERALGSIGHLGAFSFHETKNIIAGEGGMLTINSDKFIDRAEIIWEKGTNRASFFRGEVNKYGWVDTGSSFLPSEIIAAFLWAQIENIDIIQTKRKFLWNQYHNAFLGFDLKNVILPIIPSYATNNAHMYYIMFNDCEQRKIIINALKEIDILSVFHYISLHSSVYYNAKHDGRNLIHSDRFSNCLLRLPLFYELEKDSIQEVVKTILCKINEISKG